MKKTFVLLALVSLLAATALAGHGGEGTWTGIISDDKCGAKGAGDAECTKKCIEGGAKMVFVTDADKNVLAIANPDALKGHEGHHVKVKGSVENNTLTVAEVSMVGKK